MTYKLYYINLIRNLLTLGRQLGIKILVIFWLWAKILMANAFSFKLQNILEILIFWNIGSTKQWYKVIYSDIYRLFRLLKFQLVGPFHHLFGEKFSHLKRYLKPNIFHLFSDLYVFMKNLNFMKFGRVTKFTYFRGFSGNTLDQNLTKFQGIFGLFLNS